MELIRRNLLIVGQFRTPYVAPREQSPSFEALHSPGRLVRSDGSLRAGPSWRPYKELGAVGLRRDCQAGGGYQEPEVGRTLLWSGGAMLPRLGLSWPFDGSMAHRPPRAREAAWPPVARAGRDPTPRERAHGTAHAH